MLDFYYYIYFPLTITIYGIACILLSREARNRNVKFITFGGTYNVFVYYRELRKRNEKLSGRFWLYIASSANLILCMILFLIIAATIATGK